jgi:hypothetical protein
MSPFDPFDAGDDDEWSWWGEDPVGLEDWEPDGFKSDDPCRACGFEPCRCWDDEALDDYTRAAIKQRPRTSSRRVGDWRPPPPRTKRKPPPPCSVCGTKPRKSKLESRCDTCYRWKKQHGTERPIEKALNVAWRNAGDPTGERDRLHADFVDSYARQWLADEDRMTDGDERRRPVIAPIVRKKYYDAIVNDHSGVDQHFDGQTAGIDRKAAKDLFKAVERRNIELRKDHT